MAPKKREISDDDENSPSSTRSRRVRVKTEPKNEEEASDDDSVATVKTDEESLLNILFSDFESSEDAAVEALKEIANLCCYGADQEKTKEEAEKNRMQSFSLGAPLVILKVMKKYEESSEVQQAGCHAIGNIACRQNKVTKEAVAKLGGIETALSAMKYFPSEMLVQRMGCHLLANLSYVQSLSARIADHPDGIPAIIAAMKKFPDETELQQWGCYALYNMTVSNVQAHNNKIVDAEGLVVLAQAKTKHLNNVIIQRLAGKAIKNLLD